MRISGFVKVAIFLSKKYVYLRGKTTEGTITKTVEIKAALDKPLKLEAGHFDLKDKVAFRIEEVEAGKIFLIHFTSIPGPVGDFRGVLRLKTNYPEKPELTIRITGRFVA